MDIVVRKPSVPEVERMTECPVWTSGVTEFEREYYKGEFNLVAQGEAEIICGEETINIQAGGLGYFPEGANCHWKVRQPIKVYYTTDPSTPLS